MPIFDGITLAAARLAALAQGFTSADDADLLETANSILGDKTPEERQLIAARAVALGADAIVVQSILNAVGGETIVVVDKLPKASTSSRWWLWLLGGVGAIGVGLALRKRRAKRKRA